jgi:hypothetical protein
MVCISACFNSRSVGRIFMKTDMTSMTIKSIWNPYFEFHTIAYIHRKSYVMIDSQSASLSLCLLLIWVKIWFVTVRHLRVLMIYYHDIYSKVLPISIQSTGCDWNHMFRYSFFKDPCKCNSLSRCNGFFKGLDTSTFCDTGKKRKLSRPKQGYFLRFLA